MLVADYGSRENKSVLLLDVSVSVFAAVVRMTSVIGRVELSDC